MPIAYSPTGIRYVEFFAAGTYTFVVPPNVTGASARWSGAAAAVAVRAGQCDAGWRRRRRRFRRLLDRLPDRAGRR